MNDRPPLSTLQDNRLFEAETEIRQLKDAVNAMRAELERNQRDRGAAVQAAVADASLELQQTRLTVGRLRDELDKTKVENAEAVQRATADLTGETQQLRSLVQALRDQLIAKGRERARQFRWEETARQTLAVYRKVGADGMHASTS